MIYDIQLRCVYSGFLNIARKRHQNISRNIWSKYFIIDLNYHNQVDVGDHVNV